MRKHAAILLATLLLLPQGVAFAGAGSGSFSGASGHRTAGLVTVVQTAAGWEVRLNADFAFDGAPDPRVGFGKSGKFAPNTDFAPLRSNTGAQVYQVPAEIDPADFDQVYIWCRQYSVPLGVAQIGD